MLEGRFNCNVIYNGYQLWIKHFLGGKSLRSLTSPLPSENMAAFEADHTFGENGTSGKANR